jgi:ADP-ribose pyrophosphatase YjhB (NUDIX family)
MLLYIKWIKYHWDTYRLLDPNRKLMPSQKNIQQLLSEQTEFFRIAISVDCVILGFDNNELKVLLIKSDLEEFPDQWSLLGDLVRPDENLDSASYRVLRERTGLEDVYLEQVATFGDVNRHPAGRVITTAYYSLINIRDHDLKLEHNQLHWHPLNDITTLAFDHKKILDTCMRQLQDKIVDHPIVFNLLPRKFSLRELQCLYEAILCQKLDRRNFRKRFFHMDWLLDANELEQDVPHRPGKLYLFNAARFDGKSIQLPVEV